jgi:hypothetical protein
LGGYTSWSSSGIGWAFGCGWVIAYEAIFVCTGVWGFWVLIIVCTGLICVRVDTHSNSWVDFYLDVDVARDFGGGIREGREGC